MDTVNLLMQIEQLETENKLLKDVYERAREMLRYEGVDSRKYISACISFKGALQKMMLFNEGLLENTQ